MVYAYFIGMVLLLVTVILCKIPTTLIIVEVFGHKIQFWFVLSNAIVFLIGEGFCFLPSRRALLALYIVCFFNN